MFWIFLALSLLMIAEGVQSLWKVFQFRRYFLRNLLREANERFPQVALFAPIKGMEPDLELNIQSWFALDYPGYRIFFIVDSLNDPVVPLLKQFPQAELVVAGKAIDSGQKVHNLLFAIEEVSRRESPPEIFAFVDADCRLRPDWLTHLVAQLLHHPEDAATGYRWFMNVSGFGSIIRSAWNSGVLTLYRENGANNFAWGGSTAIFRSTFERCRVAEFWKGSISDDYSLTRAMKRCGSRVQFVPGAIAFTHDSVGFVSFLKWAFRQLLITRIYNRTLWLVAACYHIAWFCWIVAGLYFPSIFPVLFLAVQLSQAVKGDLRWQCIRQIKKVSFAQRIYFWFTGPVVGLCNFLLILSTVFTNRVKWRDVQYKFSGMNRVTVQHLR